MSQKRATPGLSVLVPVRRGNVDVDALHREVTARLELLVPEHELIYLLASADPETVEKLRALHLREPARVRVLQFAAGVGEAGMLTAGVERCRAELLLTLPAPLETDLEELPLMLEALREGADLALASRRFAGGSRFARAQSRLFNRLISWTAGTRFSDVASSTRALRRDVLREIPLYGDYNRYLPLLAERLGFSTCEIPARARRDLRPPSLHRPRLYFQRAMDVVSVLFISRFTRYPLRLFGGIGSIFAAVGAVLLAVLGVQRLLGTPLANRPLLVLAALLVGLGVQAFIIGLLGELILFFQAREVRDYRIVAVHDAGAPPLPSRPAVAEDARASAQKSV